MKYELIVYSRGNKTDKYFARSVEQAERAVKEGGFEQIEPVEKIYLVERSSGLVVREWL